MDKETLSHYGWIVVLILILSVMIALATPLGQFVAEGFKATYVGFGNVNNNALGVFGGSILPDPEVRYYQPYRAEFDWGYIELVFHKDGTVDEYYYEDGYMPEGYIDTHGEEIYGEGEIHIYDDWYFTISQDGTKITDNYGDIYVLQPTKIHPLYLNTGYGVTITRYDEEDIVTFYEDGSAKMEVYYDGELDGEFTTPSGTFEYYDKYFIDNEYGDRYAVYPDGTKIIFAGDIYELKCAHTNTEIINKNENYSGDKICSDCGALLEKGIMNVPEGEYIAGLYKTGSNYTQLLYSWDELVNGGHIVVAGTTFCDGCAHKSLAPTSLSITTYEAPTGKNSICVLDGDLRLPNDGSILSICEGAFENCDQLKEIYIPSTIEYIGYGAFSFCISLKNVLFEKNDNIICIDSYAFSNCESLNKVQIENLKNIEHIGEGAFSGSNIESLDLSNASKLQIIGSYAFAYSNISTINFANTTSLEIIGESTFESSQIVSIDLSNCTSLTAIENYAFSRCKNLQYVTLPQNIEMVDNAFDNNDELINITVINGGNKYISDNGVLYNTEDKTLIKYPAKNPIANYTVLDGTEIIAKSAFEQLSTPLNITLPESVHTIDDSAFYYANITGITLSANIKSIGDNAFTASGISYIDFDEDFAPSNFESYAFSYCDNLTNIIIPKNISIIPAHTFRNCESLKTVVIADGSVLNTIGYGAFQQTALESINFPSTLTKIESYGFYRTNLTEILLPSSLKTIGQYAFQSCYSLKSVAFDVNSELESIGKYSFMGCAALETITIPASVTFIGYNAFSGCNGLKNVVVEDPSNWIIKGSTTLYIASWQFETSTEAIKSLTKSFVNSSLQKETEN